VLSHQKADFVCLGPSGNLKARIRVAIDSIWASLSSH
jgi:hypothetical protein